MKTKNEVTHTPTPWEVSSDGQKIFDANGVLSAQCLGFKSFMPKEQAVANAAFIVRAVNSHEMLLEALKDATRMVTELIPEDPEFPEFIKYKKDLLEAIAKAEGR